MRTAPSRPAAREKRLAALLEEQGREAGGPRARGGRRGRAAARQPRARRRPRLPGTTCALRAPPARAPPRSSPCAAPARPCRRTRRSPSARCARGTRPSAGRRASGQPPRARGRRRPAGSARADREPARDARGVAQRPRRALAEPEQAAALACARIVEVAPFDDANGRVARLAASHLLVRGGLRPPVLVGADGPYLLAASSRVPARDGAARVAPGRGLQPRARRDDPGPRARRGLRPARHPRQRAGWPLRSTRPRRPRSCAGRWTRPCRP